MRVNNLITLPTTCNIEKYNKGFVHSSWFARSRANFLIFRPNSAVKTDFY